MFTSAEITTCKQFLSNILHLDMALNFWGRRDGSSIPFRECHKLIPFLWINLKDYLTTQGMEITTVHGDGFCFLSSVCKAIENNYGEVISIEKCMEVIMRYLVENFKRYTAYHQQKSEASSPGDTLIADVIDFFASRKYNTDIVDLLMQITTDALDLDLHIYQNNVGRVQVFNFISQNPKKVVHVKFTHDDQYPLGNHYDAITNVQPDINIRLLSEVAETVYSTQKRASVVSTKVEKEDVIDLTRDDGHSDETFISSDMESTGHFCSGHTTTTAPSTPSADTQSDTSYFSSQMSTHSSYTNSFVPHSTTTQQQTHIPSSTVTFRHFLSDNDSDLDSLMSHEPDDEEQYLLESVSRGQPFPTWYFNTFEPQYVTKIPDDINGTCVYKIKVKQHMWHAVSSDKRHFRMLTSSREGFFGERRIGTCKGSFQCCNKECPFIKTSHCHQPNRVSWRNVRGVHHMKVCAICDHVAEHLNCHAKKLIEYDYSTQVATVYHLGQHKCTPLLPKRVIPTQHPQIQLGQTLRGSAKEVGLRQIVSLIDAGDMDAAEKEAEVWLDRRRVKRQLESMDPQQGMDYNSFDAVGIVKQKTDKKDPFYIYRIGNRNLGGGTDYVFKSSRKMAQMALHMDVDGEPNILQMENAYFDATHTRVYGFKSLGLWLIHPAMKKILRLASMEL